MPERTIKFNTERIIVRASDESIDLLEKTIKFANDHMLASQDVPIDSNRLDAFKYDTCEKRDLVGTFMGVELHAREGTAHVIRLLYSQLDRERRRHQRDLDLLLGRPCRVES